MFRWEASATFLTEPLSFGMNQHFQELEPSVGGSLALGDAPFLNGANPFNKLLPHLLAASSNSHFSYIFSTPFVVVSHWRTASKPRTVTMTAWRVSSSDSSTQHF